MPWTPYCQQIHCLNRVATIGELYCERHQSLYSAPPGPDRNPYCQAPYCWTAHVEGSRYCERHTPQRGLTPEEGTIGSITRSNFVFWRDQRPTDVGISLFDSEIEEKLFQSSLPEDDGSEENQ